MKKYIYFLAILSLSISCTTNNSKQETNSNVDSTYSIPTERFNIISGDTQGTYYRIVCTEALGVSKNSIDSLLHEFDLEFSNYIPNSVISRVNNNEENLTLSNSFIYFFNKSKEFYMKTGGAFDITVAPLVNAWKFGFKNSEHIPSDSKVKELKKLVGTNTLSISNGYFYKLNPKTQIISNAIAQGYSVDIVSDFLEKHGIQNYLIDIGGEMNAKGVNAQGKLWTIGINTPKDGVEYADYMLTVQLNDKALATSGNYRKFYIENGKKYSHTIDPKTGYPVRHSLLSATIITDLCIDADALATACMVMGLERSKMFLNANPKFKGIFIYEENDSLQVWKSKGLN